MATRSTRASRHVNAPRAQVYRALLDAHAVATWMVPSGMTSHVHAFDAREGGAFRISLTYDAPTGTGKTTAHTDTYHGRFITLVPNMQVVEVTEFETTDPAMRGEMTVTFTLTDADSASVGWERFMSQLARATHFVETIYQRQIAHIEALPPLFAWRGLYRIHDTQGYVWILRLLQVPSVVDTLTQTAHLLDWLEQQHYPAPRLALTRDHHAVGFLDGWGSLLLSYIDGVMLEVQSADFAHLGFTLGQLHMLPLTNAASFPRSRCDPAMLQGQTARQLAHGNDRVASGFQPLLMALRESLSVLTPQEDLLCLTHGDCWYKNAIKTADNALVLIDWDCGGIGLPILDLGYLLLTAHYDLTQPFQIAADAQKIQAILDGYQRARRITQAECMQMQSAVQFALAFQVGEYMTEQLLVTSDDAFLRKVQTRFTASIEIAQIAQQAVCTHTAV